MAQPRVIFFGSYQNSIGDAIQVPDCIGENLQGGNITIFCKSPRCNGSEAWKRA